MISPQRPGFDQWQLHKASVVSLRSRDTSTKVGSVIIRPDKSICSEGYNGFPRYMEDRDEWIDERAEKYDRSVHAEMNALLAAREPVVGYTMYSTVPACKVCALHICAAGIKRVVWSESAEMSFMARWGDSIAVAKRLFLDCDVEISIV